MVAILSQPSDVHILGRILAVPSGTSPVSVNFQLAQIFGFHSAQTFITTMGSSSGGYSYDGFVTNHETYTITITYMGALGNKGTCTVGIQTIDAYLFTSQSIMRDVSCW